MIRRPSTQKPPDVGAVAIIVAVLAVVLFGIGALAVELTDMYSRDRAVQTTADLAAFAGAQELPDSCAAFNEALASLNDPSNGVPTDSGTTTFGASDAEMKDGNPSNGEIEVLNAARTRIAGCARNGRYVRVTTPPRNLKFSFAGAVGGGSSGDVQAVAMVGLRGLDVSVLPVSLPSNCPSGPNYIYVDNGGVSGGPSGSGSPDYEPDGTNSSPRISSLNPSSVSQPTPADVVVTVTALDHDPSSGVNPVWFDWHLLSNGTTTRSPSPSPVPLGSTLVAGSVTPIGGSQFQARFRVPLTNTVSLTQGSWKLRAMQGGSGSTDKWTIDSAVGTLVVGLPSISSCPNPSTGDFGLIHSPRSDGSNPAEAIFRNFALGLDHPLQAVASTSPDVACSSDTNPYPDGILDDNIPARGDESCVNVKPGAAVSAPTDGLIDGRGGQPGRLVGSPGVSTSGDCRVSGDNDLQFETNSGRDIVDTALSCYLASGSDLTDVRNGVVDSLSADIADDPRFFFIPVTDTTFRPANSSGGAQFWPIKEFRGAFLTNESSGGDATCVGYEDCNGLLFNNGATQLKAIQAFTFPLNALPEQVTQPGNGGDYYGGTKDFLLVE